MRCVHYVGFRGDDYARAYRVWGGPAMIHRDYELGSLLKLATLTLLSLDPKALILIMFGMLRL